MSDILKDTIDVSDELIRCPQCGMEYAASLPSCPFCGEDEAEDAAPRPCAASSRKEQPTKAYFPTMIGGFLMLIAFTAGVICNITANARDAAPVETPAAVVTEAPTPPPTPTPTPTVNTIKLYTFGRELDADGFTAYVGDKAFQISAVLDPEIRNPQMSWSCSDSVSLVVSDDGLSCEFSVLKPSGKNELTVRCYGAEVTIPVYLWER